MATVPPPISTSNVYSTFYVICARLFLRFPPPPFHSGFATAGARAVPGNYSGDFAVLGGTFSATSECRSGLAVYVRCPSPACGHSTRQQTSGREARRWHRSQVSRGWGMGWGGG